MSQQAERIVQELMEEPHVVGRRISVRRVRALVEERGLSPDNVADKLNLDIADVYRALAYYHDHPGKMHEVEQRRLRREEESLEGAGIEGPEDLQQE